MCEGWLEGYLLTGRHGFFNSYEAFIRIVDSMFSQHAKWLKTCNELPWREEIASLNYILSSNVWQQDHNGFTHQDPGFLDHVANKKADVVRLYLPPDANCLLSCFDHCIRSRNYVNVLVTSKHPASPVADHGAGREALHPGRGHLGVGQQRPGPGAGHRHGLLRRHAHAGNAGRRQHSARRTCPSCSIRVVNVVDLMRLQPESEHPHGLTRRRLRRCCSPSDKPILFAFHGYPKLIHELTYRRHNPDLHVRGYKEEGTITTPFDMRVLNDIDRFHLVIDAINYLPQLGNRGAFLVQQMKDKLVAHQPVHHRIRRRHARGEKLDLGGLHGTEDARPELTEQHRF